MIIQKFGGTSVGSASRMMKVAELVLNKKKKIIVLSAMAGTTNRLVELSEEISKQNTKVASELIKKLESDYFDVVNDLLKTDSAKKQMHSFLDDTFDKIRGIIQKQFDERSEKFILAQGEYISTKLFHSYLEELGAKAFLLDATDFIMLNEHGEPNMSLIENQLSIIISKALDTTYFITQGFICLNYLGEIDNLKRGGSDYSASIIGAAVGADEIQIWTDIDGMHNNDPRVVEGTKPISKLSFDEAAELAYFGAKILHPSSVIPAQKRNIPVRLKNTMEPGAEGTLIADCTDQKHAVIKAVAAKDGITAIKIKSDRMLMAYGFLRSIFEIFANHQTPIDMITTSEVAVSLTIDNSDHLSSIITDLETLGNVEVDTNQTIICVVGNFIAEEKGSAKIIFDALEHIPIRMISYGGSRHNVSILVNAEYKNAALQSIFSRAQKNFS